MERNILIKLIGKKLKSDLFDFSQMRMDSYVEAELDRKRRKVKAIDFEYWRMI